MEKLVLSFLNRLDRLDEKIGHHESIARWGKHVVNVLLILLVLWVLYRAYA